jgi:hypothetical protein
MKSIRTSITLGVVLAVVFCFASIKVEASSTNGTVDSTNRYAYSENTGWIDFGSSGGAVHVTASELTGYAYGENIGWLSLNCSNTNSCGTSNYKVANDGSGNLSGYAYGENIGWLDFAPSGGGVHIDANGIFSGSAYGENIGWLTFNCSTTNSCGTVAYKVSTDWRPVVASTPSGGGSSSGGAAPLTAVGGSSGYIPPVVTTASSSSASVPTQSCLNGALYNSTTGALCSSSTTTTSFVTPAITVFLNNLSKGMTSPDVKLLQEYLNSHGFIVSTSGAGSTGNETTYFGSATTAALARFQAAHGISPAVGYFGPITRGYISSH